MSIEVFESLTSRKTTLNADGTRNAREVRFFITGTDDMDAAIDAVLNELQASLVIGTAARRVIAEELDLEQIGPTSFAGSMDYQALQNAGGSGANKPTAIGEVTFSFDTAGGTQTILEAFDTTTYGTSPPNHENRINVDNGTVKGVEIVIPQFSFSVTQKFAGNTITLAWLRSLVAYSGTVNSDVFLGFQPGELLFLGASGQQPLHFMDDATVTAGDRDVEFRFAASPNRTGLTVDWITGINKGGHDYLWPEYRETVDGTNQVISKTLIGVHVQQVYPRTAFSGLGLNDPGVNFPVIGAA